MNLHTDYPIAELLPQREPMVLLSRVIRATEESIDTEWDIPSDALFVEDGVLQTAGMLEHAAQTAAALTGVRCRARGEEVRIGYIGEIRRTVVYALPAAGSTLRTHLTVMAEAGDISLVAVEVMQGEQKMMECQLKICLSDAD